MDIWLLPTLIILSLVWLYFHRASKLSRSTTKPNQHKPNRATHFHGVTIHVCSKACDKVMPLKNKRFLASEVTQLPVYGCTNEHCTCSYRHHEDRRSGEDRRYPSIVMNSISSTSEHRFRSERRKQSFV